MTALGTELSAAGINCVLPSRLDEAFSLAHLFGSGGGQAIAWHDGLVKLRRALIATLMGLVTGCGSPPTLPESVARAALPAQQTVPEDALNPDVRQDTIQQTICIPGYTATVRPSTSYTNGVKLKLLREQALPASAAGKFELDHQIPLALGGHPRSLQNLVLQHWEGQDGAKVKDRLERRLQQLVCTGKVRLDEARRAIYVDWQGAYRTYFMTR